jgi:uncharacterized protein YyaL (SSP411 family)
MEGAFHFSPRPNRAAEIRWREWAAGAFEEAQAGDRPILLSISAVWCHWCHVMDETTYSDPRVIDLLNREYVPIRVDNDVRPDVNARYNMGGWPTTALLTPQGDILSGATYLPPDQMLDALQQVLGAYRLRKPEIVARVLELRKHTAGSLAGAAGEVGLHQVDDVLGWLERAYDPVYGGFGAAPKFPMTDALSLLAEQGQRRGEPRYREMAALTLERMATGGTYDHVEGGFFRYSTTQDWSVPHFEKMLEDHGGLLYALALTGQARTLDSAASYLDRVLRDPATGLYAGSQDADEDYYSRDAAGRRELAAPYVDGRVYTAWNCGLAVAYLEADRRLGRPRLGERARHVVDRLLAGPLEHVAGVPAQLADQAYALWAAVRANRVEAAVELARGLERFADPDLGGYLDHRDPEPLGRLQERLKPLAENSVAAIALCELDALQGDPQAPWRRRAQQALESVAALHRQQGIMAAVYARAVDRLLSPPVKLTTSNAELIRAALAANPYVVVEPGDQRGIVCVGSECYAPTADVETLAQLVSQALPPSRLPA